MRQVLPLPTVGVRRRVGRAAAGAGLLLLALVGVLPALPAAAPAGAQAALPPLPGGWPATLQLGTADGPGGAAAMKAVAPFGFRYQYLAGGVNTGGGWATWNAGGEFVTSYVRDSVAAGITPVFTYYMLYQSRPGGGGEGDAVATNLRTAETMRAYFDDLRLFFQKAGAFPDRPVVLHVEPDMWGYIQQRSAGDDAGSFPVRVGGSGHPDVAGLPDTAAGLARAVKALRDRYAPNVRLGYHLSIWGTNVDIQYAQTADAETDALAGRAAAFYRSLGADFDVAFAEFSDRDAAFKQHVYGDGGRAWFDADDFRRHARFLGAFARGANERLVLWQIPQGNTRMRAQNNTWNHYQDNRVEWLLDDPTRAHLEAYRQAGAVALLFGRGADGATCSCDANRDGVTDPAPINGNDRPSLNADDDGGFFQDRARAYYAAGALPLAGGTPGPTPTATPGAGPPGATPTPTVAPGLSFTTGATAAPATVAPGAPVALTASVTAGAAATVLVDVEVYGPTGAKAHQAYFDQQAFAAGQTRTYPVAWQVPAGAAAGTYTVKVGVFAPGWSPLYAWNDRAATFAVGAGATASATPTPTTAPMATATPRRGPRGPRPR